MCEGNLSVGESVQETVAHRCLDFLLKGVAPWKMETMCSVFTRKPKYVERGGAQL